MTFIDRYKSETTWHGKAIIMSLFHATACQRDKSWNLTMTAKSFDCSIGLVSENLRLAKLIDDNPTLINIPTRQDALKKLR